MTVLKIFKFSMTEIIRTPYDFLALIFTDFKVKINYFTKLVLWFLHILFLQISLY